jgi:hypothetical protein
MKKLMTLVFALCLTLGIAANASAVEIDVKGDWRFEWGWMDNVAPNFLASSGVNIALGDGTEDTFRARQRVRMQVDFVASENVKGTLFFEIGDQEWGFQGHGAQLGTDGILIEVRRAFITFNVPNTDLIIQPGLQGIALPAAVMNSPIFDHDAAAIVTTYQFNDMVGVGAFWARPWNADGGGGDAQNAIVGMNTNYNSNSRNDEIDVFGIYVPVTMDGMFSFTPFFAFGIAGTDALYDPDYTTTNQLVPFPANTAPPTPLPWGNFWGGLNSDTNFAGLTSNAVGTAYSSFGNPIPPALGGLPSPAGPMGPYINNDYQYLYFAGAAFEFTMLDPLVFALDVNWGLSNDPSDDAFDRSGWYFAGSAAYKTPYVTPTLIGWYSTGDDDNIYNGSERMPVVATPGGWGAMSFSQGNSQSSMSGFLNENAWMGTWGVALALADISFIEDLTHQLRVAFFGGTSSPRAMRDYRSVAAPESFNFNNPAGIILTTKDWGWELNFDHNYQMYENLAVYVETGLTDVYRKKSAWIDGYNGATGVSNINNPTVRLWNTSTAWKLGIGFRYTF